MGVMTLTKAEKAAALAAARFEEKKALGRLGVARSADVMAARLVSLAFALLASPSSADEWEAFEAAKARVTEANAEADAARKALGEANAAYHAAAERRVAIEESEVVEG